MKDYTQTEWLERQLQYESDQKTIHVDVVHHLILDASSIGKYIAFGAFVALVLLAL